MSAIAEVLTGNILPIFLAAGIGYWLRRWRKVDKRAVATVVFNAFSPALVFVSLLTSQLAVGELARLAGFTVVVVLAMGLLALGSGLLQRLQRAQIAVLLLTVMFVNGGNYGLTLNNLRYGEAGLARAVVYYVTSTMLTYTVGVLIASMGRHSWRTALGRLARVPAFYAVFAALLFYSTGWRVPAPLMRTVEIMADGAIPAMLLVLGMNMADISSSFSLRRAVPATALRLLIAPFVAVALASVLRLDGLSRSTAIIEASMPTAVMTTVIATEFDVDPTQVTGIVVLTTLLSPITVALVITLFGL